jgi:hypothetical protein
MKIKEILNGAAKLADEGEKKRVAKIKAKKESKAHEEAESAEFEAGEQEGMKEAKEGSEQPHKAPKKK